MTKKQFLEQAVISMLANSGADWNHPETYWEKAERIWEANPNKGADPDNKRGARFTPPTIKEVDEYIKEKRFSGFNGKKFCAFYESKGWMVGKQKMKDWKAAVRNWGANNSTESKPKLGFLN